MPLINWVVDLFTLEGLVHFVLGAFSAFAYHWVKAKIKHCQIVFKWQYIVIPLCIGVIMYIAIQTQQSANCVREFQKALSVRSQITVENDQISVEQRGIIYNWMHSLVFPPPEIAKLNPESPERQQWVLDLTVQTDRAFAKSITAQEELNEKRKQAPYPEPTCGMR